MADVETLSERIRMADATSGVTPGALLLREQLRTGALQSVARLELPDRPIEILMGADSLWAIVRRGKGPGGLALRLAYAPGGCRDLRTKMTADGQAVRLDFRSSIGDQRVSLHTLSEAIPLLRAEAWLKPRAPLNLPFLPRDLYPLGLNDDPLLSVGQVEAAQRGLNSGVCYLRLEEPAFGSVLYFQNLTALNPWFAATGTKPDAAVGGEWPELGYQPPTPPKPDSDHQLAEGKEIQVSDALLAIHDDCSGDEAAMARRYLTLLAAVYRHVDRPVPEFRDWIGRAERSLKDLQRSSKATIRHYGFRYLHPYTDAEYPDSMVQLSVLAAIRDYEAWTQKEIPLLAELEAGLRKFYDPRLRTLRRYLPNVGSDKDKDAVDSWYLYHPLLNLGRLAADGHRRAKRLFLDSIGYGIKAARHFEYKWPIQYKITDFSVITEARDDKGLGQTDVGGIYAYVMLQAFDLTDDKKYLDEARAAIDAAKGMRFNLNYQANLTAWGAAACLRLWRITAEEKYLHQSYVYLASFFHNAAIWESQIGHARHYRNFLAVTALHDAPYMALYEGFDSFAAFEQYLKDSGPDVDRSARLLLGEYCRYALDRDWFYYPDALPPEALAEKQRENNGHIDRKLCFPVEDLYIDGQQAGQVGQEIYGAGAAFVFASRTFHNVRGERFRIFCDHFLVAMERPTARSLRFQLAGGEGCDAMVALLPTGRAKLPDFRVTTSDGDRIRPRRRDGRSEYRVPATAQVTIAW
jgi:hypothetical protein